MGRREHQHGRYAERPADFSTRAWKDILWRVYTQILQDRILLVAAGTAFYLLLALFPFLAAFVSLYGFVADPKTIADHISFLAGLMPSGGLDVIQNQLRSLVSQDKQALGFGFLTGLVVALWSANSGVKALFEGLNVVYDEQEERSFLKLNLISFAFTLGAILISIAFIISVGIVPAVLSLVYLDQWTEVLVSWGRWPVLFIAIVIAIVLIYRYGPSREKAKLRWLSWGAVVAALVWIAASWAFSFYLQNFADYNATYGTLGAVMGFMIWAWLSVIILLVGAEFNAEMEHQTMRDSTTGLPLPMGMRGATVADTIGPTLKEAKTRAEIEADKPNGPFAAQLAMRLTVVLALAMLVGQLRKDKPAPREPDRPALRQVRAGRSARARPRRLAETLPVLALRAGKEMAVVALRLLPEVRSKRT